MTQEKQNRFDIVLVLEFFRLATPYLCIIKYLSEQYKIGLYLAPTDPALLKKNAIGHQAFIKKCIELGAVVIGQEKIETRLLIVQQRPYPDQVVQQIKEQISYKKIIGYLALAMTGIESHDRFLKQFQINKVYVPNKNFFDYLLTKRNSKEIYKNREVIQVGLPYAQYPLFPEFKADYLVASPTMFSFHAERDKHIYLKNVLSLLRQIGPNQTIVYKPHNSLSRDSFKNRGYIQLGKVLAKIPSVIHFLEKIIHNIRNKIILKFLEKSITATLVIQMLARVTSLEKVTSSSEFAFEAFIPGVQKGVIGGLSNTIWGTLFFGLPFYNCVDDTIQERNQINKMLGKNSANYLDLNLGFFHIPCCHGNLVFSPDVTHIMTPADQVGDLIVAIKKDLQSL